MNFNKVNQAVIDKGYGITQLESEGYVLSTKTLCEFNSLVLLKHLINIYCDDLTDKQAENVKSLYNLLIN